MRRSLIALTIALSAALAACSASTAPGWTYAPPTPTPAATPVPSGATPAPASEAPASAPAASDGGSASGDVVKEAANQVAYVNKDLAAPAGAAFKLEFDNQDAGIPHNIAIKDASGADVFKGAIFNGVAVQTYDVPALAAGDYTFVCSVHPNMTGTLKVGG
jgi:plastocyanin